MYKVELVKPVTRELVLSAGELASKAGKLEEKIVNRINYIMASVFKLFGKENAFWYFYGAGKGEVGDLWSHYRDDYIRVVTDNCPGEQMIIFLKDGSEWGFEDSIPTRWLFEDFEEELVNGKKKYQQHKSARKENEKLKRQKSKEDAKVLAAVAKSKLTKQELAALKKNL